MKHSVSTRKELTILKLEEAVFDIRFSDCFKTTIDSMVNNDSSRNVIIDFSQVKAIDSSGISSMLLAHQLANRSDGLAIFVSLCQQIKDLLKLTNLDKQLYIFSSINEVMTLIEPALKGKRGSKSRPQPVPDENPDEIIPDEIDILPEEVFSSESYEELDEEVEVSEEATEEIDEPPPPVENAPKKRGRPKKNHQPVKEKPKARKK